MYEYKFIELKSDIVLKNTFNGFEDIINEQAQEGYRFVSSIPKASSSSTGLTKLSLVFEKKISE